MTVKFSLSPLFFWIKGSISVDQKFVKVHSKNTILGVIPAGNNDQTIPVNNISAANMTTSFSLKPMIIAIIFLVIAVTLFGSSGAFFSKIFSFIIFGLLAFSSFANAFLTLLVIQRAGSDYYIAVPFYEKKKMLMAKDAIDELLAGHLDNINVRAASKDIIKAMKEK